jgi:hypothetical protein
MYIGWAAESTGHEELPAMAALDQLFALEVEFQRRLRIQAPGWAEAGSIHTSYAIQSGYERLLQQVARPSARNVDQLVERSALMGDRRDAVAAGELLKEILGLGV